MIQRRLHEFALYLLAIKVPTPAAVLRSWWSKIRIFRRAALKLFDTGKSCRLMSSEIVDFGDEFRQVSWPEDVQRRSRRQNRQHVGKNFVSKLVNLKKNLDSYASKNWHDRSNALHSDFQFVEGYLLSITEIL